MIESLIDNNKIMRVVTAPANIYVKYYRIQAGGGYHGSNIGNLYKGSDFVQRGYGIGSFLVKAFKYLKPLALNGLQAIGSEGYKTGKGVFNDIIANKPLDQIIRDRSQEAMLGLTERGLNKIKQKMASRQSGNGIYRPRKRRVKRNSSVGGRRKRTQQTKQVGGRRGKSRSRRTKKSRKTTKRVKRTLDIFQ